MIGLAIDIGGTKIAAARVDPRGQAVGDVLTCPTPAREGPDAVLAAATALAAPLREGAAYLGVSSAGVVNPVSGAISSATDAVSGWAGTQVRDRLGAALDLPTTVLNDGHAFALGEYFAGAGAGIDQLVVIAFGTGIGGGHVVAGSVQVGSRGLGGHFGHISVADAVGRLCSCGARGHAEAVAGGVGIVNTYKALAEVQAPVSLFDVERLAVNDAHAQQAISLGGRAAGALLASITSALDPEVIVIAGGVANLGTPWRDALADGFAEAVMPGVGERPIRYATPGPLSALVGAAAHARKGHL